jgi:hypothetical protein
LRIAIGTLVLFSALAIAHTWPLGSAPATWSRNDSSDAVLHEWIMAWVAHAIVTDPVDLYDANIFYPERNTLAYSDPLIVQALLGAPFLWAGASPVLAYNLVLIAGFALTGWVTCLLLYRWTGNIFAGVLSGSLVAFSAFTLTRLPQIQDQHLEFYPVMLFALDRLLHQPDAKAAWTLAVSYVLQALAGTYLMVFTGLSMIAGIAARPRAWLGPDRRRFSRWALVSAAVAVALLLPFLLPYYTVSREAGLNRSLQETAIYSAEWGDYLAAAGTIHFKLWSRPFFEGDGLFPGFVGLGLTLVALATGVAFTDRRARMLLVIGLASFALSFGPVFPPYRWLYYGLPLMRGIRGAVRFGQLVLFAVAVLAGFGLVRATERFARRTAAIVSVLLIVLANAEAWRAPLNYVTFPGTPPIYDALNTFGPKAIVVWVPFHSPSQFNLDVPFMLFSTRSWVRMLNGYSGFIPPSYSRHSAALADFPSSDSIRYLQEQGVTHVLVETRTMGAGQLARLPQFTALRPVTSDANLQIFSLAR